MIIIRATLVLSLLLIWPCQARLIPKIIGGKPVPSQQHPGFFNTVALLKTDGNTVFCTGSIIADDLIVTAKHCLVDKKISDFTIFFGETHHRLEEGTIIEPLGFGVRYPTDWQMFFPSLDIAWVKLKNKIPAGYKPLPILKDPTLLTSQQSIDLVGFGNHNPKIGQVDAGDKLWGLTRFDSFLNDARYYNILYFSGDEGQGTCHGDSGGPAYAKVKGKWYLIGVANGFDPLITTISMSRLNDPDFPYIIDCSKNQVLYTFVGAHLDWITTQTKTVFTPSLKVEQDREKSIAPTSLKQWCLMKDFGSPRWNLLKDILNVRTDILKQTEGRDYIANCDAIVEDLEKMTVYNLDFENQIEAYYDLSPLALIKGLRTIKLKNVILKNINFHGLEEKELDLLAIENSDLKSLNDLPTLLLKELKISNNPLSSLDGIERFSELRSLDISSTSIHNLTPLSVLPLEKLKYSNTKTTKAIINLVALKALTHLSFLGTPLPQGPMNPSLTLLRLNSKSLSTTKSLDLSLNIDLKELSIQKPGSTKLLLPVDMPALEKITITEAELEDISFLKSSSGLTELNFYNNQITDLSVFSNSYPALKRVNMNSNPIKDVSALQNLSALKRLLLRGTPLHDGSVLKTQQNCPIKQQKPGALSKFCAS
jgi:hypothetical protein